MINILLLLFILLFVTGVVLIIIEVTKGNGTGGNGTGGNGNGGGNDYINTVIKLLKEKGVNILGLDTCPNTRAQLVNFKNRLTEGDGIYVNCNTDMGECMSLLPPGTEGNIFYPIWVKDRKILREGEILQLDTLTTLIN